ncbi:TetR/AcrR family transcriptional regulator [Roseibium porphyridii]|uniref:TetR/AcrR family transcriptional regulator n=1 Tax=Roseibium porphyridii TaxID=2866279 RepID=A0ABY8F8J5_9HYPH|nr:TetR/AcrR family transcriptional regulator [Roseibium sp. KMA01]WFE91084.1 TetR/AcrR family transcriptional regulator [Roseibium sp. KMA01]
MEWHSKSSRQIDTISHKPYQEKMIERDIKIVETALQLFAHYGVKKTTMSEIANAAGVARQSLYNAYDGKEDLIYGALEHRARVSASSIVAECSDLESVGERLDVAFKYLVLKPCEIMLQVPHREEILQVVESFENEKKNKIIQLYNNVIMETLSPFEHKTRLGQVSFAELCNFIRFSFDQMKKNVVDLEQLHHTYSPLKKLLENSVDA